MERDSLEYNKVQKVMHKLQSLHLILDNATTEARKKKADLKFIEEVLVSSTSRVNEALSLLGEVANETEESNAEK